MNEIPIKSLPVAEPGPNPGNLHKKSGRSGALALLANSFNVLVNKFGNNLDASMGFISEKHGLTAISNLSKTSEHYHKPETPQENDYYHHQVTDRKNDFSQNSSRDNQDTYNESTHKDLEANVHDERPYDGKDPSYNDKNEHTGSSHHSDNSASADEKFGNDDGKSSSSEGNAHNLQKADPNHSPFSQQITADSGPNEMQLLGQVHIRSLSESSEALNPSQRNAMSGSFSNSNGSSKDRGIHTPSATNNNTAVNNAHIQVNTNGENRGNIENIRTGQSSNQQQAQQIAKGLGENIRMQINVNVSDESNVLTSRPLTSLAAGTAVSSDNKGQNLPNQAHNSHSQTPGQNPSAVALQGQAGGTHSQNAQANTPTSHTHILSQIGSKANGPTVASAASHSGITSSSATSSEGASGATNLSNTGQTPQTQQTLQAQQSQQTARPNQPLQSSIAEQVSVKITKALQAGQDRITIRLNPAELGRVEVKMELTFDGRTTAIVTADSRDTLDLLRRDSSALQKALEDGGLQLSDSDLSFNLRGEENQTANESDENSTSSNDAEEEIANVLIDQEPEIIIAHEGGLLINGRLDVRA